MSARRVTWALTACLCGPVCAAGGESPVAPLVRFPDVKGGEVVVTKGLERPVRIRYGRDIAPATFRATLNGAKVTHLFNPGVAGGAEAVRLPLVVGENKLRIEVNSRAAASDPRSVLMPQEHLLTIRLRAMDTKPLSGVQVYSSQEERDAALERTLEKLGVK